MRRRDFLRGAMGWTSVVAVGGCRGSNESSSGGASITSASSVAPSETAPPLPWPRQKFIEPDALALQLDGAVPSIVNVGPEILFHNAHVPGAEYAGEAGSAQGIEQLAAHVATWPRDRTLIVYCGCCPWKNCPNIRPAYERLGSMGFKDVRVLDLPVSFRVNWVQKGLPIAKG